MGVDPGEGSTEDGHGVEIESVGARHAVENACPKYRISSVGGAPGTLIRLASSLSSGGDREHRERDRERERMERDRERERERDRERDRDEHELKVSGGSSSEDRVYASPSSSVAAERLGKHMPYMVAGSQRRAQRRCRRKSRKRKRSRTSRYRS